MSTEKALPRADEGAQFARHAQQRQAGVESRTLFHRRIGHARRGQDDRLRGTGRPYAGAGIGFGKATVCGGMHGEVMPGIGKPGGVSIGGSGGNEVGSIIRESIGSGGCGSIPIISGGQAPSNGSDDGITMMIVVVFASLFRNGQEPCFVFVTFVLSLQQHLPSLQQHSPPLPHSHLLSLQQVQLASHFLLLQQQSPSLQHFPSLQHAPASQQSSVAQHFAF